MAKGKKQTAPRCCECKKLLKGVTHEVNILGGTLLSKMCDSCYHQNLQCDVCFNFTAFADGAVQNQADNTGDHGDGVICSDCYRDQNGSNTGLALVIEKSRELLDAGNKIEAIRIVRQMTADMGLNYGLKEAKELVETYDDATPCEDLAEAWRTKKMPFTCCACNKQIGGEPIMFEGNGVCESCARTKTGAQIKATVPVSAKPAENAPMAQKIAWLHATYPHMFDERGNFIGVEEFRKRHPERDTKAVPIA
jgi:hypothetical protein